jgi:hypothetical protein
MTTSLLEQEPPPVESMPLNGEGLEGKAWSIANGAKVKRRRRGSAFASGFSAVLNRVGCDDACRKLDIDPSYFRRLCLTIIEVTGRVEEKADEEKRPYPELRRDHCASYLYELHYKRAAIPGELFSKRRADELEKYKKNRGRQWQRRRKVVARVMAYTGHRLFEFEAGDKELGKSPAVIDRLSDVVADTIQRARSLHRFGPVRRYNEAADLALIEFRKDPTHVCTPVLPPPKPTAKAADDDAPPKAKTVTLDKLKERAGKQAAVALADLRRLRLSEADEWAARDELIAAFTCGLAEVTDPEPESGADVPKRVAPPETKTGDTHPPRDASARLFRGTNSARFEVREARETRKSPANAQSEPAESVSTCNAPGVSLTDAELAASVCASVGVERFGVVVVDDTKERGEEGSCIFAETVAPARFRDRLPYYLAQNERNPVASLTVRLRSIKHNYGLHILQVDDATPADVELLKPFAFWGVATSPGSAQVWLALAEKLTVEQYNELRQRLFDRLNPEGKKALANGGAHGSMRWIGSLNRKPKRRLADGTSPRVEFLFFAHGRRVRVAELEAAGLLAPAAVKVSNVVEASARFKTSRIPYGGFPSLDDYLLKHRKPDGAPDRSSAESAWCCASLRLGFSESAVEDELSRITLKGRGRSYAYVRDTVTHAADFLARQPDTSRGARERMAL